MTSPVSTRQWPEWGPVVDTLQSQSSSAHNHRFTTLQSLAKAAKHTRCGGQQSNNKQYWTADHLSSLVLEKSGSLLTA